MKIEQLLVQHFYQKREVTLQGLGKFTLSPDVIIPTENDKDVAIPANSITFQYNPKATEDDELIDFIVQQTRKIKPLASADLDSYLVLGKQFLNIGKPFKIEGIGTLEKNQPGEFEFIQGHITNNKKEAVTTALKEKSDDEDISFATIRNRPPTGKKRLLVTAAFVLIAATALTAWYFFYKKPKSNTEPAGNTEQVVTPPNITVQDTLDTKRPRPDSVILPLVNMAANDSYLFKVVFKETINKKAALLKMNDLVSRGHHVIMYTSDSVYYKLAEPFKRPLSDTARIRDSLNKYFYLGKAYIELY